MPGSGERVKSEFSHFAASMYRNAADFSGSEPLGWLATPTWLPRAGDPLALALLSSPCNVRDVALRTLTAAGIPVSLSRQDWLD